MKTKNHYQRYIAEYLKRRERYKQRHGHTSITIQTKIDNWRQCLRRIERRERLLAQYDAIVKSYMEVSVKNSANYRTGIYAKARCLFYKYCMENGVRASDIARYCGCMDIRTPSVRRLKFTRSFATNSENKELWHRFKQFIKQ